MKKIEHPLYKVWSGIKNRCYNINEPSYKYYGARGIILCERWHDFDNFVNDMGPRKKGLSIDRIDSDGNYEPGNCRWATRKTQNENRRISKYLTASKLARLTGYSRERIRQMSGISKSLSGNETLVPFMTKAKSTYSTHNVYHEEAIEFLLKYKKIESTLEKLDFIEDYDYSSLWID